jgi:hypothetical protein
LEAEDDKSLLGLRAREHPATAPTNEQVMQAVATHAAYDSEYAPVHVGGAAFEEEEGFGPDPY